MKTKLATAQKSEERSRKRVLLLLGWLARSTEEGIVRYAREAGWSLNLQTMRTGALPEPEGIDGVIALLGGVGSRQDMIDYAGKLNVPIVDMHADEAANVPAGRVLIDNRKIGRIAADHFQERGFTRCLYTCKSLLDHSARDRWLGFSGRLKEHGLEPKALECFPDAASGRTGLSSRQTVDRLRKGITEEEYPLAIFAENDDFAVLVLEACEKLDLRVPEEVAVLGCGNHALIVDFSPVPLSSIGQNFIDRAYRAAQLLDQMMAGGPIPEKPELIGPGAAVTRRSTDILAVNDLRVARALSFIRHNYADKQLDISSIAQYCGMSIRTLTRLFKKHLKRGVAEEIKEVRIRQACQILENSDRTFSEIAEKTGFSSLQHFRRNFQQTTGVSPRGWRHGQREPVRSYRKKKT
ncbi:MAG: substrate-binding domain-containing protein [Opitutales bacterium]